jgi:hypothetical protein
MNTPGTGKLERVPFREVREHETYDFTHSGKTWPTIQDGVIQAINRLERALRP